MALTWTADDATITADGTNWTADGWLADGGPDGWSRLGQVSEIRLSEESSIVLSGL